MPGAKPDAYFDPKAEDLLTSMFLAAALDNRPITDVYIWVTVQVSKEPVQILEAHDYPLQAAGIEALINIAPKQRRRGRQSGHVVVAGVGAFQVRRGYRNECVVARSR